MRAHICAIVVKKFVVDAKDAALCINGGAHVMMLLARVISGNQVFPPVLDPFDRALEF